MNPFSIFYLLVNFTLPGVNSQGDRVYYGGANSLGLGGISVVLENGDNPAGIGLSERISFYSSGLLYSGVEKRGLRVYDSYGNNIGVSTVVNNHIRSISPGPVVLIFPLKSLRFGVRYHILWDFTYFYYFEYRDDFYQITKIIRDDYNGGISSVAPIISLSNRYLKAGIEECLLYGKISKEFKILFPGGSDSITHKEYSLTGRQTKCGLILTPFINLSLGYSYARRHKLKGYSETLVYPESHTAGISYQPPGRIPTKFLAEIRYERWDKPIYIYKFGIEHTIIYKHKLRYGFCLFPDYNIPAVWMTNLTIGFGTSVKNFTFDIGLGYGKRDYANTDFGGLNLSEKYIFDETLCPLVFSVGILL